MFDTIYDNFFLKLSSNNLGQNIFIQMYGSNIYEGKLVSFDTQSLTIELNVNMINVPITLPYTGIVSITIN
jgi:small nuclear ribonucleoprotein (snRNP)-like protein